MQTRTKMYLLSLLKKLGPIRLTIKKGIINLNVRPKNDENTKCCDDTSNTKASIFIKNHTPHK
ncbi:hypothetical protein MASR1M74_22550 [Lentimicrobium sp.]